MVMSLNCMVHAGGTFALYSLICRYAKVGLIPSQQAEDTEVSNYQLEVPTSKKSIKRASKIKSKLENSNFAKLFLLFSTMLGTSMVIGDGVLTPCISGTYLHNSLSSFSYISTLHFHLFFPFLFHEIIRKTTH